MISQHTQNCRITPTDAATLKRASQALGDITVSDYPLKFLCRDVTYRIGGDGISVNLTKSPAGVVIKATLQAVSQRSLSDHELAMCGLILAARDPQFASFSLLCEKIENRKLQDKNLSVAPEAIVLEAMLSCAHGLPQGLLSALEHSSANVRLTAVRAIGTLGRQALPAINRLEKLQGCDKNQQVREATKVSIAAIEKKLNLRA